MISRYIFITAIVILCLSARSQPRQDTTHWATLVNSGSLKVSQQVNDLDSILFKKFPGWKKMANPGGKFNAADTGSGPHRRLYFTAKYKHYWIVSYEHGNKGYHTHCFFVALNADNKFDMLETNQKFESFEALKKTINAGSIMVHDWVGYDY